MEAMQEGHVPEHVCYRGLPRPHQYDHHQGHVVSRDVPQYSPEGLGPRAAVTMPGPIALRPRQQITTNVLHQLRWRLIPLPSTVGSMSMAGAGESKDRQETVALSPSSSC